MLPALTRAHSGFLAALDIGSTKICCFIARVDADGIPRVVGIGHHAARGVRAGVIADLDAVEDAIRNTVHDAEQQAGVTLDEVLVGIAGGFPVSRTAGYEVPVNGHQIGDSDVLRVLQQSRAAVGNGERTLVHAIPVDYSIDGTRGIRDPRGMFGERLGVNVHQITAATGSVRTLANALARCHLDLEAVVVAPFAAGLAVLVEDEMDLGVTVIDMGGGTTSLAVFYDGSVVFTDSVPLGGVHVTQDIARGLGTAQGHAERIKTVDGSAFAGPSDAREMIEVPPIGEEDAGQDVQVARSALVAIIRPRLEEILEMVRGRLQASGFEKLAGRRAVLIGGASQLPGLRELAAHVLDKRVRLGRVIRVRGLPDTHAGPAFATCAGMLSFAAQSPTDAALLADTHILSAGGLLGRIGHWLRETF